ncbi:penicillin-binding protein A [Mycobacterium kansasii 824]|nr:penicillin-binding protein A [Mycobacterium kansasii 824]
MNASLRRISVTVMALIVLLLLNATMTQVFTADGLRADPRNQRVLLDEYSRQRGQITAGGQLLAYSVATDSRFRFLRVYPNPEVYAPVTGFYSLRYSSTGLERAEDPLLNGSDERLFGRRLADFFTGRDPRGGNVDTTINPRVQQAGWDAMQQGCGGPCKGAVVALEPSTGKILALVSSPSYDPNLLASHDPEVQAQAWQRLRDNPDSPLTNRAIAETYPPGSTFKVITTAGRATGRSHRHRAADRRRRDPAARKHGDIGELRRHDVRRRADRVAERGIRQVVQHRIRPVGHAYRRSRAAQHGAGVRPGHFTGPDTAAGGRVDHRPDRRYRRIGYDQYRAEGRRPDPTAERRGRGDHRQRRDHHAALPGGQPPRARPGQHQHHCAISAAARGVAAGRR